jgi:hypothetical protein
MVNWKTQYTHLIKTANGGGYDIPSRSAPVAH